MKLDFKFNQSNQVFNANFSEKSKGFKTEVGNFITVPNGVALLARIGVVTLFADKWVGANNFYSQVVSIEGVTENSQVDITPNAEQLSTFYEKDLAFVAENEDGVVTVYVIGQKPMNDYVIQVTITEVSV